MNPSPRLCRQIVLSMCAAVLLGPPVLIAGTLDAFEADVRAPATAYRTTSLNPSHRDSHGHSNLGSYLLAELFADVFGAILIHGGHASYARVTPHATGFAGEDYALRPLGHPLLSFVRVDVTRQRVSDQIDATDLRGELGYGPWALHHNYTWYDEDEIDDLEISRTYVLYRMSVASGVEFDLGVGSMSVKGDAETDDALFTMPILVHAHPHFGIEYRPLWADRVEEQDLSVLFTFGSVSLKAGYRWVETPGTSLNGPYVGGSVRF